MAAISEMDFRCRRPKSRPQFQSAEVECTIDELGFNRADTGELELGRCSGAGMS